MAGSNQPIEDSRSEAMCLATSGLMFGVFDGHGKCLKAHINYHFSFFTTFLGGPACSQVISKRLIRYLAANLAAHVSLRKQLAERTRSDLFTLNFNDKHDFVDDVKELYEQSFIRYASELANSNSSNILPMKDIFENAFLRLDRDISDEAISSPNPRTLSVALSGSCAVVAHIERTGSLSVASCGDCVGVLGSITDTGMWTAKKLTNEHNSDNVQEIRRILSEHPSSEKDTVIKSERLLGQLAPLRALGDFKFKWSKEQLAKFNIPSPPHYQSPPYLSAIPEITQRTLTPKDKFLGMSYIATRHNNFAKSNSY